jgi:MarR family transcriptional regulator, temperature-dependent positive regulator of motility
MQKQSQSGTSLDEFVVHLLHRVSQRADDTFGKEVGDADLTPRQFAVLFAAAAIVDPSQTDLVVATGIDRSTVAEMIRRMVKKGLLQRRRSRRDSRAYVVRVTEAGKRVLKATEPQARQAGATILASLSSEQRKTFIEALKAVAAL